MSVLKELVLLRRVRPPEGNPVGPDDLFFLTQKRKLDLLKAEQFIFD